MVDAHIHTHTEKDVRASTKFTYLVRERGIRVHINFFILLTLYFFFLVNICINEQEGQTVSRDRSGCTAPL